MNELRIEVYGLPAPQGERRRGGGNRGLDNDPLSGKFMPRHGMFGTPEYEAWRSMLKRCYAPSTASFPGYGGRGISVYGPWKESFQAFFEYIGRRPSVDHSLGRIDNDGNYEPGNIRWETRKQQQANRRSVRLLTHNGRTLPLADWAAISGVARSTLLQRLNLGWSVSEAITKVPDKRKASR